MARVIIRDVLIFMLLGTMVFSLMFAFVAELGSNYGLDMPDQWQNFADNVSEDSMSIYSDAVSAESSIQSDEGIEESSSGDEFTLGASALTSARKVFEMPAIAISFISEVSKALPIPDVAKYTIMGIILVLVVFTFISMLARKDT